MRQLVPNELKRRKAGDDILLEQLASRSSPRELDIERALVPVGSCSFSLKVCDEHFIFHSSCSASPKNW